MSEPVFPTEQLRKQYDLLLAQLLAYDDEGAAATVHYMPARQVGRSRLARLAGDIARDYYMRPEEYNLYPGRGHQVGLFQPSWPRPSPLIELPEPPADFDLKRALEAYQHSGLVFIDSASPHPLRLVQLPYDDDELAHLGHS